MTAASVCLALLLVVQPAAAAEPAATAEPAAAAEPAATRADRRLSLAEALKLAEQRNLGLEAARTDIARARADLKYTWALLLPTIDYGMSFVHNDHADEIDLGDGNPRVVRRQQTLTGNLQLNLPLVSARGWLNVWTAELGQDAAELTTETYRQALLLTVAQAYYAALALGSLCEVHRASLEALERHLTIAELRHRSGTGARLDVVRARTELVTTRDSLQAAEVSLANAREALGYLVGLDELPLPMPLDSPPEPGGAPDELVETARRQREDLKLGRVLAELADRRLTSSWMSFVPSLNLTWQLNQQITDPGSFSDPDQVRWYLGLSLSVPIYDHTRYAELDQLRAGLARAELELRDAELSAEVEVRQAHRDWRSAVSLAASAEERAALAAEALKLSELAYANGGGDSLAVTDAQRSQRQAVIDLAAKRYDAQLALLALWRRTGHDMLGLVEGGGGR